MSAQTKASLRYLLIVFSVFFLLALSAFCLRIYGSRQKVLGVKTEIEDDQQASKIFWEEFLAENPDYLPGWLEIGRLDKAGEINPNFSMPPLWSEP